MRLSDSEALLARALEDINKRWDGTSWNWRDKAREEFEKEYLDEMRNSVKGAQQAIRNIQQLLQQVIKECK